MIQPHDVPLIVYNEIESTIFLQSIIRIPVINYINLIKNEIRRYFQVNPDSNLTAVQKQKANVGHHKVIMNLGGENYL